MKFSDLKNKKTVKAYIAEPFNTEINFKIEEQINAITEAEIYRMFTNYKGFVLEFWVANQEDVDLWRIK